MVTIARRKLLTALAGTAAWPLAAIAQQPKVWRIGVLAQVPPTPAMLSAFRDGMRGRGFVEGDEAKPVHRRSLATRIIRPRPECCD